jgi:hypothetical protein
VSGVSPAPRRSFASKENRTYALKLYFFPEVLIRRIVVMRNIPVFNTDGDPLLLDRNRVFSISLDGRRIIFQTVDNEIYYWPLSIEDIVMFLPETFEISDRKNVIDFSKVKMYDSNKKLVYYCDEQSGKITASAPVTEKKMREIKRLLGKQYDLAEE